MVDVRTLALLCVCTLGGITACTRSDPSPPPVPSAGGAADGADALPAAEGEAVWKLHHDENLALPHCPGCDEVVDRAASECAGCGAAARVVAKDIPCPECAGSKECAHCATCIACESSGQCPICDGSAKLDGETCPECDGAATCVECATGAESVSAAAQCEHCSASGACANCEGKGTIRLE